MATPDPEPTPRQLVKMSGIFGLTSSSEALAIISDFDQEEADARWAETLDDLDIYSEVSTDGGEIKKVGTIEFFEGGADDALLSVINRVRQRYGVAEVSTLAPQGLFESTVKWF